jgi:hypothetical protein
MPVAKSLALATVLIFELTTLADTAPRSQSGYSRPVPKQGGGGNSSNPRT